MLVNTSRTHLITLACVGLACVGLACDCDPPPDGEGNQDPESLAACPALPPGVEPIAGLSVGHASDRFGGLTLTMSTRALACGETAVQNSYCSSEGEYGLTLGIPAQNVVLGSQELGALYMEFETPTTRNTGGGGILGKATLELYTISDECVTGRVVGLASHGGPFDGGFQAPRCEP